MAFLEITFLLGMTKIEGLDLLDYVEDVERANSNSLDQ